MVCRKFGLTPACPCFVLVCWAPNVACSWLVLRVRLPCAPVLRACCCAVRTPSALCLGAVRHFPRRCAPVLCVGCVCYARVVVLFGVGISGVVLVFQVWCRYFQVSLVVVVMLRHGAIFGEINWFNSGDIVFIVNTLFMVKLVHNHGVALSYAYFGDIGSASGVYW